MAINYFSFYNYGAALQFPFAVWFQCGITTPVLVIRNCCADKSSNHILIQRSNKNQAVRWLPFGEPTLTIEYFTPLTIIIVLV